MLYSHPKETTSEEVTPIKVILNNINLPMSLKNSDTTELEESQVIQFLNVTLNDFNTLIELNPSVKCKCFTFLENKIFYHYGGPTPLHESAATHFIDKLRDYNNIASSFLGRREAIFRSTGQYSLSNDLFSGIPDVGYRSTLRSTRIPNVIIEVAYSSSLYFTHQKALSYFQQFQHIQGVFVIHISYPWESNFVNGRQQYNLNNGRIVCFMYDRDDFTRPFQAISFGNNPIDANYQAVAIQYTNIHPDTFFGHGIPVDPPCNDYDIPLYLIGIPFDILLDSAGSNGQMENQMITNLQEFLQIHPNLVIDLFELKRDIIDSGLSLMNNN